MKHVLAALLLMSAPALAETCPEPPDHGAALDALVEAARAAPTEAAGRALSDEMWGLWTDAPDARAQGWLDEGMERREAYDFAGAEAAFDALVDYCPDYAEGYNQRAFSAYLRGDYGSALEDLDSALERSPAHVGALSGKALTLMGLGRIAAGQAVLREALDLNPWLSERRLLIEKPGEDL